MSGFSLLSIGSRAMAANYVALQTTGHNIANAGVEGYSRQRVETATAAALGTPGGFIGTGVDVETVSRAHDEFLTREAASAKALAAMDATRLESLQRLEAVFRPGEQGIGHAASEFLNAMVDMASRPADIAARQVVLARAETVAGRFRLAGTQLDALQGDVETSLKAAAARADSLVKGIAELNVRIQGAGQSQPPNDLLDERDRLVSQLSEIVQVKTIPSSDGSLSVFFAGGVALVNGSRAVSLGVVADEDDPNRLALQVNDSGNLRAIDVLDLGGGTVAGALRFQDEELQKARAALGQMAVALAGVVNEQQSLGLDLRQPAGRGAAVFDISPPLVRPATTNLRSASGEPLATVQLEVIDPRQVRASDYALRADAGTGNWQIERLSDGMVFDGIVSGSEFDGLRLDLGTPAPALSDRFLLQPVSYAAAGMRRALDDPRGLAAAGLLSAAAGVDNEGTGSVARLRVTSPEVPADLDVLISVTGAHVVEMRDRASDALLATGQWARGQAVRWDVDTPAVTGFELVLDGQPALGDVFTLSPTGLAGSDNANARAFAELRDSPFIGRAADGSGQIGGGVAVSEAWTAILSGAGVQVQAADAAAQISRAVADEVEARRSAQSGVNLDEEAARLIQYQQSYQAAAKVLQVAQAVFDTLLQTTST